MSKRLYKIGRYLKKTCIRGLLFVLLLLFFSIAAEKIEVFAMNFQEVETAQLETEQNTVFSELFEELPLHALDEVLRKNEMISALGVDFRDLIQMVMRGEFTELVEKGMSYLKIQLLEELNVNGTWMGQVLVLGILGAVFTNYAGIFSGSQIAEAGFYIIYLLCITFLASAFLTGTVVAEELLIRLVEFMQALIPAFFLAVSFSGGSLTSSAGCGLMLISMNLAQAFFLRAVIPAVQVYLLLVLAGHLIREDLFSRTTELIEQAIRWSMKSVTGIILGFHLLQGMVIPYADAVKNTPLRHFVRVIPGIGQGAEATSQMILGAGVLVKNSIGTAGIVLLCLLSAIPLLKLCLLTFLYQGMAAVLQPVCEKRLVSCISAVSAGLRLLLTVSCSALFLFVLSLAIICAGTNTAYFSG